MCAVQYRCLGIILLTSFAISSGYASSLGRLGADWEEYKPGGRTACARGGDFSFFVSPGSVNKVVIDFMGGGACWDGDTCNSGGIFIDSIEEFISRFSGSMKGAYDRSNIDNPFKDWHHVVIPYCTGDIHWGDSEQQYRGYDGNYFAIEHRGAANARAVLSWLQANYRPDTILVTGCSAGAYGSIYWTPHVRKLFTESRVHQFGDSGVGVISAAFNAIMLERWRPDLHAPRWIPSLDPEQVDWTKLGVNDLYKRVAAFHSDGRYAQLSSKYDIAQTFFYELMGGDPSSWSQKMSAQLADLRSSIVTFSSYISGGENHCVLPNNAFYTQNTNGVLFRDWLAAYIDDQDVDNVECVDCGSDPWESLRPETPVNSLIHQIFQATMLSRRPGSRDQ